MYDNHLVDGVREVRWTCNECCGTGVTQYSREEFQGILADVHYDLKKIGQPSFKVLLSMYREWIKRNHEWECHACQGAGRGSYEE